MRQVLCLLGIWVDVLEQLRRLDVFGGCVYFEVQQIQLLEYLRVVDRGSQVGQLRAHGYGGLALREGSYGCCVIIPLDVFPTPGNSYAVQQLKEVEVQLLEEGLRSALFDWQLAPCVEHLLRLTEDSIDVGFGVQLFVDLFGVAFVGQCQLVA